LRGSVFPKEIIAFGGHLDSWDKGEGAHDDGAGVIHSLEALRLLKETGYQPRYTLRLVFFMNEENGNRGGKTYAAVAKRNNEIHVAAIESDRGGFSPRGFSIDGTSEQVEQIAAFKTILEPYGLHAFEKGYGGVDINPIKFTENKVSEKTILLGFVPDSQRYFDFHHADTDVWENVNKRELELGCASMASMIFLLDKYLGVDGDLKVPDAY
jgi:carboxypeptidase Q